MQAMRAGQEHTTDGDTEMRDAWDRYAVLIAIAKADSMLELLPTTTNIEAVLRELLPVYDHEQLVRLFKRDSGTSQVSEDKDYARIFSQISAPDIAIRRVWKCLCVSRCPGSPEGYFIPTTRLLKSAWTSAFTANTIRASEKGKMEQADFEDDEDGIIELLPVKNAVWQHLGSGDGRSLNGPETVTWVIRTLWQSMWEVPEVGSRQTERRSELEAIWRSALPREHADAISVDKLEAGTYKLYEHEGEEMVRWTGQAEVISAAPPTTSNAGKRKWHEKFQDSKRPKT